MDERVAGVDGKILELTSLHDEYPAAVEATLIAAGLRWRHTSSKSPRKRANAWRDIWVVIESAPFDSPIMRAQAGNDWPWLDPKHDVLTSLLEQMQAVNVKTAVPQGARIHKSDFLQVPRPWDKAKTRKKIGTPMPLAELDAWLAGDFTPTTDEKHGGRKELAPTTK